MNVVIMCAVTLDGKIAKNPGEFINWSGSEDKKIFSAETKKAGVVIMGHNTYKTIGRPLKDRLNIVLTSNPHIQTSIPQVVEFTSKSPKEILEVLEKRGFQRAFVIGGAKINTLFLNSGLVNELWLTIVPKMFGGGLGLTEALDRTFDLHLISSLEIDHGLMFLKYRILSNSE